jgi:hypothetical protein
MESRLVDLDLPYIIILIAHPFNILLTKEYNFKLADSYKILAPSIYRMYYKYARLIYT